MENQSNPMELFQIEAPAVSLAFNNLIEALKDTNGLDAKTKQLLYIAMKASLGDSKAIYFHTIMAKQLGASREEIKDTILITLTVCGISGVATCLPIALSAYDIAI